MPTAQNLLTEFLYHIPQFTRQAFAYLRNDLFRHPFVVCLRYGASYGCQGIGVTAQGDGLANGIFEVFRFQKGGDSRWDSPLAGFIELIRWADIIQGGGVSFSLIYP